MMARPDGRLLKTGQSIHHRARTRTSAVVRILRVGTVAPSPTTLRPPGRRSAAARRTPPPCQCQWDPGHVESSSGSLARPPPEDPLGPPVVDGPNPLHPCSSSPLPPRPASPSPHHPLSLLCAHSFPLLPSAPYSLLPLTLPPFSPPPAPRRCGAPHRANDDGGRRRDGPSGAAVA